MRPSEPHATFETIGSALPALVEPSSTGQLPGESGSGQRPTVSENEARAWLLAQPSPRATDEALARSLTNTCGVTALLRAESRFPPEGGWYQVITGCVLRTVQGADPGAAIRKLEGAMTRPTAEQAEGWLVMLQAGCRRRTESEAASAVGLTLYSGALQQYPADVAKDACLTLVRGKNGVAWFPSLAELLDLCDRLVAPRKAMLAALRSRAGSSDFASAPPEPTPEERQAVRRMMEEHRAARPTKPKSAMPFQPPPVDEGGLTAVMREHLARTRPTAPDAESP
jgi:hypothetical protein